MKHQRILMTTVLALSFVGLMSCNKQSMNRSEMLPQPDLHATELKDLPVAPEGKRVDMKRPTFSNPTKITHPLFPEAAGGQTILLGNDDGRALQVVYTTLPESHNKKIIWDGQEIETRTTQYVAHMDRRLVEYALDWYAQADDGSIWYFGEDVFNYADGELTDNHGTWLTGKDGTAAMIMPADPKVGDVYRVENIPGVAFEEVEVKVVNATVDGPLGRVTGCMIGEQLHDNGSYSDKTFCPGRGEFFTEKDLDLEALALSVPTDALRKPVPAELASLTAAALTLHDAAGKGDWKTAEGAFIAMQKAWYAFRLNPDKVSTLLAAQMDRALRMLEGDLLEPALAEQHVIGTRNGALDVALASLDLELRYRLPHDVDRDRLAVFARKTLIDATALEHGPVLSDVRTIELIRDRIVHTIEKDEAARLNATLEELRSATDDEDFEAVQNITQKLLTTLSTAASMAATEEYDPNIVPSEFTTKITNKYFSLPVGKKMTYEAEAEEGTERIELEIESDTKMILGVKTIVYRDRVYVGKELVEDTKDYLAQDREGNVWYFGEDVNNYENGKLKNHDGSWIAGEDGAKPGIWIKSDHQKGDSYRQEYYKGEAEDMRDVIAVDLAVTTKLATYTGCVQMYDWTPLDAESREHKYYCPEAGALVLNENLETGKRAELLKVANP